MTDDFLSAALAYAARGWYVFPVEPHSKEPHPTGGTKADGTPYRILWGQVATKDEAQIRKLWGQWPQANIALVTGEKSGFDVLDIDHQSGGDESLAELEQKHGRLPATVESLTGGGGRHLLFAHNGHRFGNDSKGLLGPGIHVRTTGGYIVAPPSIHPNGHTYEWEVTSHPDDVPLAEMPEWVVKMLNAPRANPQKTKQGARISKGRRNSTLTTLAGSMRRSGADEAAIYAALAAINSHQCSPPLDDAEVRRIAASVARYQPANALNLLPLTDTGNAEAIRELFGETLRFDHRRRRWLIWDQTRWKPDDDGAIDRQAIEAVRERLRASASIADDERRKEAAKWALSSESRYRLQAAIRQAQSLHPMADAGDQWDRNPYLLGCVNGVIDLTTGDLLKGHPDDRITMSCGIVYDPIVQAPRWELFLREIFGGDDEMVSFIQRAAGYSLTGDTREQCMFLLWGSGCNGKTTLLGRLRAVFGDYAINTPFSTFELKRDTQTNDLAALYGRHLITASETSDQRRLNEGRVKAVTGGDPVTARFLYGEFFDYVPTFKLWLSMNYKPIIAGTDEGIWRRVRLVPFNQSFKGKEDKLLDRVLDAELLGILNWAVQGCLQWQAMGLAEPKAVLDATQAYRDEMDVFGDFIGERCEVGSSLEDTTSHLHSAYANSCKDSGEKPRSKIWFGHRLAERGFTQTMIGHARGWRGIRVKP